MRLEPNKLDKFAGIFKAGAPRTRKPPPAPKPAPPEDEDIAPGVRLYKTARERQIEAIDNEKRILKKYRENRQRRLDSLASEVPAVSRFLKAIAKAEPDARPTAYRDVDIDLASLARRLGLADVADDYGRFTIYEEAVAMVARVAKRARRYTEPEAADFFCPPHSLTALDELKLELRLR